jgi:uncharacterized protein YdhG (YjbR/CyaY superfamily)
MYHSAPTAVDTYLASLAPDHQKELLRIQGIVMQEAPSVTQGISYAMPAYIYKGKALLSCMVNKSFISIYPFSGKVIEALRENLEGYGLTTGSIHFTLENSLSDSLVGDIVRTRIHEIESGK